ncbi:hypothetical protein GCM10007301_44000 [Azorhizobium oxalatiphilum]|uniref:Methyltransferase FkbM domain-containing protein n=1 Tax=Azorhizobium oxalatiphilum TaxID=980631 RepID=A0A917CCP7_9HYPH|nr:FkbM family methyltransferase [Azorhizobium oxalatiphilum]GGF79183.1 hypothetical protein GCM10007301_44000 [Azorhizobium oxalatiphilum]
MQWWTRLFRGRSSRAERFRRHAASLSRYTPIGIHLGGNRLLSRLWTGNGIFLPADDIGNGLAIVMTGCWEPHITFYLAATLKPGDVFVDIGANVGYYTILASELVKPSGLVAAFEPQKALIPYLADSIHANGFDPICHCRAVAIGAADGVGTLNLLPSQSGSASLTQGAGPGGGAQDEAHAETVQILPLDRALGDIERERGHPVVPTIIKMDIEGYEYAAWQGMRETVAAAQRLALIIEFAPCRYLQHGQDPHAFLRELEAAGFTLSTLDKVRGRFRRSRFDTGAIEAMIANDSGVDLLAEKGLPAGRL